MSDIVAQFRDSFNELPPWARYTIAAVAVIPTAYYFYKRQKARPPLYKTDFKHDVVYLYQFHRSGVIPSLSPFCLKLESWLRVNSVKYESIEGGWGEYVSSEGQLPFVEFNGVEHPDSAFAIRDLTALLNVGTETHLSDEQRATARAIEAMVEESLFWSLGFIRYLEKRDQFMDVALPPKMKTLAIKLMLIVMSPIMKMRTSSVLYYRGVTRHSRDEIIRKGLDDLRALSAYLGSKPFFMGDKPTRCDCAVFGVLAQLVYVPIETPHLELVQGNECENLRHWCDRMKQHVWPDWETLISPPSNHQAAAAEKH